MELSGGREPANITIVDYDPHWVKLFAGVEQRIRRALGAEAGMVEHIGSTSVPGLAAKPIIDVLVTVADVTDEAAFVPQLETQGYRLRVREPDHRMLRTPERTVHIHVYEADNPAIPDYLDLRDWLRVSAEDRALYAATKRQLSRRQWDDMNDYADAKSDIIAAILARARAWRGQGSVTGT